MTDISMTRDGISPLAIQADTHWDDDDRPLDWQGRVFGLVVHTTGSGLPASADGGHLLQLANEREQAAGVGVTNSQDPSMDQRRSIEAGRFEADLPPVLVRLWRERRPSHDDSLALLPGTRTANSCYVHVECVPCVYHAGGELVTGEGVEPMRPGLRFTEAQHATVAALAVDVARRNGWPANGGLWLFDLVGDIGARLSDLVATGQEHLAIALARQQGVTDVDELTNLLFFARHPEMGGRRIAPEEAALAQEWIDIRDTIVRPTLHRSSSEAVR